MISFNINLAFLLSLTKMCTCISCFLIIGTPPAHLTLLYLTFVTNYEAPH